MSTLKNCLRQYGRQGKNSVQVHVAKDYEPYQSFGTSAAVLEICNPSSRNAFTGKMMAEFSDALDILTDSTYDFLIVKGCDQWFCAGADIHIAKEHLVSERGGKMMSEVMTDNLNRLRRLKQISFSVIGGIAVGGGAELAVSTDFRIMDSNASIRFVHGMMGVVPGWGGGYHLKQIVGRSKALHLLCTAKYVRAQEGKDMGLVDCIAHENIHDTAMAFIDPFSKISKGRILVYSTLSFVWLDSLRNMKNMVDGDRIKEQNIFLSLWGGPDNLKAINRM